MNDFSKGDVNLYCESCGSKLIENQKFCESCGQPAFLSKDVTNMTEQEKGDYYYRKISNKAKELRLWAFIKMIFMVILIGVVIMILWNLFGHRKNNYIDDVKNGAFTNSDYPDVKIGDAWDEYFGYPEWNQFEREGGIHVVSFTGDCTVYEETVTAYMEFIVYEDESFYLDYLSFDGVEQIELVELALIDAVLENYEQ